MVSYDLYQVAASFSVSIRIDPSGRVASANVIGDFAQTPTGSCVEGALKLAKFPAFNGAPQTIEYPLTFR
jgi:hypothetical protein